MKKTKTVITDCLFIAAFLLSAFFPTVEKIQAIDKVASTLLEFILIVASMGILVFFSDAKEFARNATTKKSTPKWSLYNFLSDVVLVIVLAVSNHVTLAIFYATVKAITIVCYEKAREMKK